VEFDLKLLFYYNFRRHIESTVDFNDFRCIRLHLFPLKTGTDFLKISFASKCKKTGPIFERFLWPPKMQKWRFDSKRC
jgi:hypothetical protein